MQPEARCTDHRRAREKARGTRQQRGYDAKYDRHRRRAERDVRASRAVCWSCNQPIAPDDEWHDGHCEDERTVIHGPEHAGCNLRHIGMVCPHISHAH